MKDTRMGRWPQATPGHAAGDEPCYVISIAARMVGVHAQTLRTYERVGLVAPARSRGNVRMYSPRDVQRALWIRALMDDLGINLAGVEVIIRMHRRIEEMEREMDGLREPLPLARTTPPPPPPEPGRERTGGGARRGTPSRRV